MIRAAVVDDDVAFDLDRGGLRIDFDDHRVNAARRAAAVGPEVGGALEPRFGPGPDRPAQRVGLGGQVGERDRPLGRTANVTRPSASSRSSGCSAEEAGQPASRILSRTSIAAA